MQTGTTPSGKVETVPDFRISLDGSSWPAASGELPAGTGSVVDFSIQRDLTGGGLPGAARGGSGFSVASGSVTLPMNRAELTPWAAAGKRVSPGGLAWFRAHPTTLTSLTLGRFIVDECSGASMGGLKLDLVESQRQMDGPLTYPWMYNESEPAIDAASVLAGIAHQTGFRTTSQPLAPTDRRVALSARLHGSIAPEFGRPPSAVSDVRWASWSGRCGLAHGSALLSAVPLESEEMIVTERLFQIEVAGRGGRVAVGAAALGATLAIHFDPSANVLSVFTDKSSTPVATFPLASVAGINIYRVHVSRTDGLVTIRLAANGAGVWTTYGTISIDPTRIWTAVGPFSVEAGSPAITNDQNFWMAGFQVYTGISSAEFLTLPLNAPTAFIEHTGSMIRGVFDVSGKSAREVFQAIAAATMGAGWQSETGDLIYRNAASLRTGVPVEAVVAQDKLESLDWSVSRDNTADRVTVTYTPADVQQDSSHKLTLWEATEPIMVPGNRTVTVTAEITGTTDRISPFRIVETDSSSALNAQYSRWHASSSREGGGTRPADDAIRVEATITGPSTVKLTITNTTNGTLWLVDGNGNPLLILRTSLQVQPGEAQVIEWGQPEDKAIQPFDFDCGQWVQDASTAQAMLAWLVDQLRSPLPTITQVRIIPDLRRQLGDIVTLTDTEAGLKAKALITGLSVDGDAGGYTQRLTLAILSVTYSDVKRWARAQGITTYGQLKAHLVAQGATTYTLAREYLARVGVDA